VIYDALLAMDLHSELGPTLPTPRLTGLENLLFTGRWGSRRKTCTLSSAVVLARCCRVLSTLGCSGLSVRDDAGSLLAQAVPADFQDATARWPESLPPSWQEQPCELEILGSLQGRGIAAAITLRYTPRHDPEQGALTGSLRALWDVRPTAGEEEQFQRSMEAALMGEGSLRELSRRLTSRGEQLALETAQCLGEAFTASAGSTWGRVLVLHGYRERPERFADLLAGLPEERRLALALLEDRVGRSAARWPAMDAHGVHGHVKRGHFVPSAEVAHVA